MRAHISNQDYEKLSAYIDGQLAPGEKKKLEERMRARPELKVALDELSQTRSLIRMIPHRRAPRNFTLTPAMVADVKPRRRRGVSTALFPALSFASALAVLALVATLLFQTSAGMQPANSTLQEAPAVAMEAPAAEEQPAAEGQPAEQDAARGVEEAAPAEPEMSVMEQPAAEGQPAAEEQPAADSFSQPPIVTWNDPGAAQIAPDGLGGMGGYAPLPGGAWGKGGGGGEGVPMGAAGSEGNLPGGGLILPLEAAGEGEAAAAAAAEQPEAQQPAPAADLTGGGPILGLPSTEQAGEIEMRSAFGQPLGYEASPVERQPAETRAVTGEELEQAPFSRPALPWMVIIQVTLGLLAIITGVAAFFVYRRRA